MQEILAKTEEPNVPLREQEFFELILSDRHTEKGLRFCVTQFHIQWSDEDGQMIWDQEENELFWVLAEAKRRYAERRQALSERGFVYSDMEM